MQDHPHKRAATASALATGLLTKLTLEHGPIPLLGRFFAIAVRDAAEAGLTVEFGTLEDVVAVNRANRDNWRPLAPVFDPAHGLIHDGNAFAILGRDAAGDIVAVHCAHHYEIASSLEDEIVSQRLFYADPGSMQQPGEAYRVLAPTARRISGSVTYSGAAWYRPDWRSRGLSRIFPRLGKACALTRWNSDWIVSVMAPETFERGMAPKFGYTVIEHKIEFINTPLGTVDLAFLAMDQDDLIDYLAQYLSGRDAQIDRRVADGRT
jgi:hypothetical protein